MKANKNRWVFSLFFPLLCCSTFLLNEAYASDEYIKVTVINLTGKKITYGSAEGWKRSDGKKCQFYVLFSPPFSPLDVGEKMDIYLTAALPRQEESCFGDIKIHVAGCSFLMDKVGTSKARTWGGTNIRATTSAGHDISCAAEYVNMSESKFVIYPYVAKKLS